MVAKIGFTISPEGEVSVNVNCATGDQCDRLTQPFEEVLGTVQSKKYKDEYYQTESENSEENLSRQK